jgi:hypothetical protein
LVLCALDWQNRFGKFCRPFCPLVRFFWACVGNFRSRLSVSPPKIASGYLKRFESNGWVPLSRLRGNKTGRTSAQKW